MSILIFIKEEVMKLKKLFAFVVAGMMAISLAACTDGNGPEPSKAEQSQS